MASPDTFHKKDANIWQKIEISCLNIVQDLRNKIKISVEWKQAIYGCLLTQNTRNEDYRLFIKWSFFLHTPIVSKKSDNTSGVYKNTNINPNLKALVKQSQEWPHQGVCMKISTVLTYWWPIRAHSSRWVPVR